MTDSTTPEQVVAEMQQSILQLEQFITNQHFQQAQPSAEPSSPNVLNEHASNMSEDIATLHSLETRPSYTWTAPAQLEQYLSLKNSLFSSPALSDDERKHIIEQYPPQAGLHYQPPDTIPIAARQMNRGQSRHDMNLKRLQYLVSGIIRPLDVLYNGKNS